jgi:hypothetical protein
MLLGIERRALGFVLRRWNAIYALAKELYARGNLGRSEIARVLERATITLNENAAETAYGLISAGLINTGFAWNDETDVEEEYGLGVDAPKDGTAPKYFYPFGKEVKCTSQRWKMRSPTARRSSQRTPSNCSIISRNRRSRAWKIHLTRVATVAVRSFAGATTVFCDRSDDRRSLDC